MILFIIVESLCTMTSFKPTYDFCEWKSRQVKPNRIKFKYELFSYISVFTVKLTWIFSLFSELLLQNYGKMLYIFNLYLFCNFWLLILISLYHLSIYFHLHVFALDPLSSHTVVAVRFSSFRFYPLYFPSLSFFLHPIFFMLQSSFPRILSLILERNARISSRS